MRIRRYWGHTHWHECPLRNHVKIANSVKIVKVTGIQSRYAIYVFKFSREHRCCTQMSCYWISEYNTNLIRLVFDLFGDEGGVIEHGKVLANCFNWKYIFMNVPVFSYRCGGVLCRIDKQDDLIIMPDPLIAGIDQA